MPNTDDDDDDCEVLDRDAEKLTAMKLQHSPTISEGQDRHHRDRVYVSTDNRPDFYTGRHTRHTCRQRPESDIVHR